MLSADLRDLVQRTRDHARARSTEPDHTVAGGLLTASGQVVLGLNTFHFLGGPCGEIAALSNHAANAPDDPIVASAAAFGPQGEVIPPCGKCRQVLYDIDPGIRFVVRDAGGLVARTASELLPFAYETGHADQAQQIHLWAGYEDAVRRGTKRQTVRIDDPFHLGPADLAFEQADGRTIRIPARVTGVRAARVNELTEADALADGFTGLDDLHQALQRHYPGLTGDDPVDVVTFELTTTPAR